MNQSAEAHAYQLGAQTERELIAAQFHSIIRRLEANRDTQPATIRAFKLALEIIEGGETWTTTTSN